MFQQIIKLLNNTRDYTHKNKRMITRKSICNIPKTNKQYSEFIKNQ